MADEGPDDGERSGDVFDVEGGAVAGRDRIGVGVKAPDHVRGGLACGTG